MCCRCMVNSPPAEQDKALNIGPRRRVALATSIAETSLTVLGVRIVVDGGFRRAPRLDGATGLTRLVTLRISRAAAEQRADVLAAPSCVAVRLWSEATQRGMALQDRPEMLEAELSGLVLDCAAWGADPLTLPFLDPTAGGPGGGGARVAAQPGRHGCARPHHRDGAAHGADGHASAPRPDDVRRGE